MANWITQCRRRGSKLNNRRLHNVARDGLTPCPFPNAAQTSVRR